MSSWSTAWPSFDADEIEAVQSVLQSGRVNYWGGAHGHSFEREFAEFHGAPYGIALANGSVALELALQALDVRPGDDVVVSPRTFVASASCIVLRGARPVFADVSRDSGNVTAETVRAAMTARTRAILAVHLGGWPCDMDALRSIADEWNVPLIEDCAQAHGARWRGHPVGSQGDAAAFSFCTDKIMSTGGEGGMLLLRDESVWRRAWSYKDHGKSWDAVHEVDHAPGFRWLHDAFGTNWRLTEMQSAIGRIQLRKLPQWLARRRANAEVLISRLGELDGLRVPLPPAGAEHAWYKFYAFVVRDRLVPGWSRDRIVDDIQSQGVPCLHGGCSEVYLEKAFTGAGLAPDGRLPVAQELGETSIMLLVDHTLTVDHMHILADAVEATMERATAAAGASQA